MGIIESVYKIDKMASKYFVPFSVAAYGFLLGWNYSMGENIFSSITQDISQSSVWGLLCVHILVRFI